MRAELAFMHSEHRLKQTVRALDLSPMVVSRQGVTAASAQTPVALLSKMSWLGREARRVMGAHHPGRHVRTARSEMCHAGIDVVPAKFRVPAFAKRCLDVGIELAKVVKRRRIYDGVEKGGPPVRVAAEISHHLGARPGAFDDSGDVIRVKLRRVAGSQGRVGERTLVHRLTPRLGETSP
jgi:hypothetical protein